MAIITEISSWRALALKSKRTFFFARDFRARQQMSYFRIIFHLFSLTESVQTYDNPTPSWVVWESFPSHYSFCHGIERRIYSGAASINHVTLDPFCLMVNVSYDDC